jgi:uncharacterized tellurite resistance protein B-like protein
MDSEKEPQAVLGALAEAVERLENELGDLRDEVARLDRDLDESRRLNLRAAELLDIVFEHLGGATRAV